MFLTLSRIIKYGFKNFLRNGWLSTATIAVMFLALFVLQGLIIFNVVAKTAITSVQNKIDISVYFKSNVAEDEILNLKKSLEGLSEVKKVEYISQDQALAEFKARHQENSAVSQAIEVIGTNPLLSSLNIKANNPKEYAAIADYLNNQSLSPIIEKVSYAQNQVVINRLISIVDTAKSGGIILSIIAAIIAVLVAFNTIRLAIYTNRDAIGIMRVVGASNNFIRGPYIVEGVLYGILAAVLSFAVIVPLITYASPYVNNFIPDMNLQTYFASNFLRLLGYQLLFGIILGTVSSFIAVRRHLQI
ncbi:MAG: permease-like cell division protein FtsX [bacterium]|nr:permease-like cell division protein FtsX [bacterium]